MLETMKRLPGATLLSKRQKLIILGMLWEPLESDAFDLSHCTQRAHKKSSTHCIQHQSQETNGWQLGTIPSLKPEKAYYSAALLSLHLLGPSWLGFFIVAPETYWVVAAYEGLIVPSSDIVFENFEEARARFETLEKLFHWEKKFFEKESAAGENLLRFEALVGEWQFDPSSQLLSLYDKQIKRNRRLKLVCCALGLIGFVGSSIAFLMNLYHRRALQAQENMTQALQREAEKNGWRKLPPAKEFLEISIEELSSYRLQESGWRLVSGTFDGKSARAVYQKTAAGTHQGLMKGFHSSSGELELSENPSSPAKIKKVHGVSGNRNQEKLERLQDRRTQLQALLERGLISGKVSAIKGSTDLKTFDFSFNSSFNPKTLFASIPLDGVSFDSIGFSMAASGKITWNCSGKIYGI